MIRTFGWRDFPTLYRYRKQGVSLNNVLKATRAPGLIPAVLLSCLSPSMGLHTWIESSNQESPALIGQFYLDKSSAQVAYLNFLTPAQALESPQAPRLVSQLAKQAGKCSAFHVLADCEVDTPSFHSLKQAGFSIAAYQRIWQWNHVLPPTSEQNPWQRTRPLDVIPVERLYQNVVPKNVIQLEPLHKKPLRGLVYYQDRDAWGYAQIKYGHNGIWTQVHLHPEADELENLLLNLFHAIPERQARPLYVCVRAYQGGLEPALKALKWVPSPKQALMVKHLVAHHKVRRDFKIATFNGQPEAPMPLSKSEFKS
jgi:hypothetical protein